jgi:hypothetical protein
VVEVLEQLLTGQIAALPHDAGEPGVVHGDVMHDAALAAKMKPELGRTKRHVTILEGRETE